MKCEVAVMPITFILAMDCETGENVDCVVEKTEERWMEELTLERRVRFANWKSKRELPSSMILSTASFTKECCESNVIERKYLQ